MYRKEMPDVVARKGYQKIDLLSRVRKMERRWDI